MTESRLRCTFSHARSLALLDRVGSVGALIAAIAAPCCFPLFAALSAAVGLGARSMTIVLHVQAFAALSFSVSPLPSRGIGTSTSDPRITERHRWLTLLSRLRSGTLYGGLFGLLAATVWNYFVRVVRVQASRSCAQSSRVLAAIQADETMHERLLVLHDCPACHARLKPAAETAVYLQLWLGHVSHSAVHQAVPEFDHDI